MQGTNYNSTKNLYKRLLVRFILAVVFILFLVYVFPKFFRAFSPFIIALIVAVIVNSIVNKINKKIGKINKKFFIPRRTSTLILNLLILVLLAMLMYFLVSTIIQETIGFTSSILQNWHSIVEKIDSFISSFQWLTNILPPQTIEIFNDFMENAIDSIQNVIKNFLTFTVSTTASVITRTGNFIFNLITFFLALFFITSDYGRISEFVEKHVSKEALDTLSMFKNSVLAALGVYFKAQVILALFAFAFMFVALSLYGQQYAFLIALMLGIVDLLPLLGTIAILLPWGVVEYIAGDVNKGIFLVILGVAFFLIRRIIEPKVMGSQTGLHPLLTLLAIYVGLQFSGAWGAILGPIALMLLITVVKSGIFDSTIADLKVVYRKISILFKDE